jgi:hypothetical protein
MAKLNVGQTVRIKRSINMPDGTHIRKATEGTIKEISGGFSKKYTVQWRGIDFVITHAANDIVGITED